MKAKNYQKAWEMALKLIPGDYSKDKVASERAGYDVYVSDEHIGWVSDLGDRLEVNTADGMTINIWIEPSKAFTEPEIADALRVIDHAIYRIEDEVTPRLLHATRIEDALKTLRDSMKDLAGILKDDYPASVLFSCYNLDEV